MDLVLVPMSEPSPQKPLLKGQQLCQGLPHLGTRIQSFPDTSHGSALKTVKGQNPKLAREFLTLFVLASAPSLEPSSLEEARIFVTSEL